jgi:hypothetical protein
LRRLIENLPTGPVEGDAMTAMLKADRLVHAAPWSRDSRTGGLLITPDLQEFISSIDLRSLEDTLHLLSGLPRVGALTNDALPLTISPHRSKAVALPWEVCNRLEGLKARFEAAARIYPNLRLVLIETPGPETIDEVESQVVCPPIFGPLRMRVRIGVH